MADDIHSIPSPSNDGRRIALAPARDASISVELCMKEGPSIAPIAALAGDPARANMLAALLAGTALTASELAGEAGVSAQTASSHLAKLEAGGLIAGVQAGPPPLFPLGRRRRGRDAGEDDGRGGARRPSAHAPRAVRSADPQGAGLLRPSGGRDGRGAVRGAAARAPHRGQRRRTCA